MCIRDRLPPVFQGIERLRVEGHDVTLIHILDRDELDFPFDGVLQLTGLEDNQEVRVEAGVIADRYQALVSEYCEEFEAKSRNLGADYELFVTDVNLQTALLAYFQRIQSRRSS